MPVCYFYRMEDAQLYLVKDPAVSRFSEMRNVAQINRFTSANTNSDELLPALAM